MNFFVTGTDTDCGKTFIVAGLVRALRAAGADAVAAKPFCCGPRDEVATLDAANDGVEPLDAINPVWLKSPAAPRACELLGEAVPDLADAVAAVRGLSSRHACVLCEGAGGWLVPAKRGLTLADLAVALGWPVIVVVPNKLGSLNHALLTLESVRARGLDVAGLVLNNAVPGKDAATRTNRSVLEEFAGDTPVLLEVAFMQTDIRLPDLFRFPAKS